MGRHGQGGVGHRQGLLQVRQLLARVAVEHGQDGGGGHQPVVVAPADRLVEEEVARLLEAGQGAELGGLALDVAVAGLPVDGLGAIGLQHLVGDEQARGLHVDDEGRAGVHLGEVAGQHQADLVGEDLLALVVDHPAAVAVAVEAERQVRAVAPHHRGHGVQHDLVFGVRIVVGEAPVELRVHLDHLGHAHAAQGLRREGAGRAVAAGGDHLQRTLQRHARGDVGDVAFGHAGHVHELAAGLLPPASREHDLLQPAHLVRAEGQGLVRAHLDPGPAVLVVAGGDHGHARRVQIELGEIGHGRDRQADVEHLAAGGDQAQRQGLLDREGIGAEVVADHDAGLAELLDVGPEPEAQGFHAKQVDLRPEQPARVVFAKAGRLDQGFGLIRQRVRLQVGARRGKHSESPIRRTVEPHNGKARDKASEASVTVGGASCVIRSRPPAPGRGYAICLPDGRRRPRTAQWRRARSRSSS